MNLNKHNENKKFSKLPLSEAIANAEEEKKQLVAKWKSPRDDFKWTKRNTQYFVIDEKIDTLKSCRDEIVKAIDEIEPESYSVPSSAKLLLKNLKKKIVGKTE